MVSAGRNIVMHRFIATLSMKNGLFTRCAWVNDLRACIDMLRKLYGFDGAAIWNTDE